MILDEVQLALLELLKMALWGEGKLRPLTDVQWRELIRLARVQTVTGLVCSAISNLPDELLPPDEILMKVPVLMEDVESENARRGAAQESLLDRLEEIDLHPIVLKGTSAAALYPEAQLRMSGDIDLYFPGAYDASLASAPSPVTMHADDSYSYEWESALVEVHRHWLDVQKPGRRDALEADARLMDKDGLTPEGMLLLLHSHTLKHALGVGVGLRQICDLAAAYRSYHDAGIDLSGLRPLLKEAGLASWAGLAHAFLMQYLGMNAEYLPYVELHGSAEPLMKIVLRGGNFGMHRKGRRSGKLYTAMTLLGQAGFALRYAPAEGFWRFVNLAKGQKDEI